MREIRITLRCVAAPTQHAKIVRVRARLGRRKAEELAELLDGSSLAFVHPPGPSSPIGRCAQCGAQLEATVSEIVDGEEVPPTVEEIADAERRKKRSSERKLASELTETARKALIEDAKPAPGQKLTVFPKKHA